MSELTEEQLAKLPKWARSHIWACHANIRSLEAQVNQMTQGPGGSKVRLVRFAGDLEDQPLPDRTIIAFDAPVSEDEKHTGTIEARLEVDGDGIYLMGSTSILIEPSAANCATVRLRKR